MYEDLPRVTVVTYAPRGTPAHVINAVVTNVDRQLYFKDGVDHNLILDTYEAGELECNLLGVQKATTEWVIIREVDEPMWFPTWLAAQMRWATEGNPTRAIERHLAAKTYELMKRKEAT